MLSLHCLKKKTVCTVLLYYAASPMPTIGVMTSQEMGVRLLTMCTAEHYLDPTTSKNRPDHLQLPHFKNMRERILLSTYVVLRMRKLVYHGSACWAWLTPASRISASVVTSSYSRTFSLTLQELRTSG